MFLRLRDDALLAIEGIDFYHIELFLFLEVYFCSCNVNPLVKFNYILKLVPFCEGKHSMYVLMHGLFTAKSFCHRLKTL